MHSYLCAKLRQFCTQIKMHAKRVSLQLRLGLSNKWVKFYVKIPNICYENVEKKSLGNYFCRTLYIWRLLPNNGLRTEWSQAHSGKKITVVASSCSQQTQLVGHRCCARGSVSSRLLFLVRDCVLYTVNSSWPCFMHRRKRTRSASCRCCVSGLTVV